MATEIKLLYDPRSYKAKRKAQGVPQVAVLQPVLDFLLANSITMAEFSASPLSAGLQFWEVPPLLRMKPLLLPNGTNSKQHLMPEKAEFPRELLKTMLTCYKTSLRHSLPRMHFYQSVRAFFGPFPLQQLAFPYNLLSPEDVPDIVILTLELAIFLAEWFGFDVLMDEERKAFLVDLGGDACIGIMSGTLIGRREIAVPYDQLLRLLHQPRWMPAVDANPLAGRLLRLVQARSQQPGAPALQDLLLSYGALYGVPYGPYGSKNEGWDVEVAMHANEVQQKLADVLVGTEETQSNEARQRLYRQKIMGFDNGIAALVDDAIPIINKPHALLLALVPNSMSMRSFNQRIWSMNNANRIMTLEKQERILRTLRSLRLKAAEILRQLEKEDVRYVR